MIRSQALLMVSVVVSIFVLRNVSNCTSLAAEVVSKRPGADMGRLLTEQEVAIDLKELHQLIREEWLLSNVTDADFGAAIETVREKSAEEMTMADLAVEIKKVFALGVDSHVVGPTRSALQYLSGKMRLPFVVEPVGERYVAVAPTQHRRNQMWRGDFPYVIEIDGIPIQRWIDTATALVARSHKLSLRAKAGTQILPYLGALRRELGVEDSAMISVMLESSAGRQRTLTVDTRDMRPASDLFRYNHFLNHVYPDEEGHWRILDGNVGYLWLENGSSDDQQLIIEAFPKLRGTRGLIIDLRANEGGVSAIDTLQLLGCWLTRPQGPRHIVGVNRCIAATDPYVDDVPYAYRPDSPKVTPEGRTVLRKFARRFHSSWTPPEHVKTRDWYYLLAPPTLEPDLWYYRHPEFPSEAVYEYRQPVVVIVDRHCFSAAETVANGLQCLPQVTVIGERTRGGTATSETRQLSQSGMEWSFATESVSLKHDGTLTEGHGVEPDIRANVDLRTISGLGDTMLDSALRELQRQNSQE